MKILDDQSKINQLQKEVQEFLRLFGVLEQNQTPCGCPINITQAHALQELSNVDKLTQQQLSEILRIDKSTTSRLVEKLILKGFASRDINIENRRQCYISLTSQGRNISNEISKKRNDKYEGVLQNIENKEQEQVLKALNTLSKSLLKFKNEENNT